MLIVVGPIGFSLGVDFLLVRQAIDRNFLRPRGVLQLRRQKRLREEEARDPEHERLLHLLPVVESVDALFQVLDPAAQRHLVQVTDLGQSTSEAIVIEYSANPQKQHSK